MDFFYKMPFCYLINSKAKNNNWFGKCKWIHTLIITSQRGFHWLKSFAFGLVLQKVICFDIIDLFGKKSYPFVIQSKVKRKPQEKTNSVKCMLTSYHNCYYYYYDLAHRIICVLSDWPKWLPVWFWF